jgi:site-specific DNA-methyltransferase (adenine-specific)
MSCDLSTHGQGELTTSGSATEDVTDGSLEVSTPPCTPERFAELEATVERGIDAYIHTGQALAEIRDTRAYLLAGYPSFNAYLDGRWEMGRRHAFKLVAASAVADGFRQLVPTLAPACNVQPTPTFTQALELARLEPVERRELLNSLERPLAEYSTRELQRRTRAFQQELEARRALRVIAEPERTPRRRLVSDDIQIEVLDAAHTSFDDGLFDLLIGSPPFALDVPYADGGDVPDYPTYRRCMAAWSTELYRISNPTHGRVCLEVPVDRSKNGVYEPVYHHWLQALEATGFRYRTTFFRRYHAGRGSARGSIDSPSGIHTFAPLLAIIVVSRGEWVRHCEHQHDLEHDDWLALAGPNGIWDDVPGEADPEHPAPFHLEVPRRLLKFAGCPTDLVGDLFVGRGTTALACVERRQRFHGGDRSATYVAIAEERVAAALDRQQAAQLIQVASK